MVHAVCLQDCPDSSAALWSGDANGRTPKIVTNRFLCGKVHG
jgi:hypothetical protein